MTYYLNPYVIIVKRGNSCFYQFDNSLYYLTLKEYEMLINLSENQNKFSQERLNIFVETKLLINCDYDYFSNKVDYVNRGWFEMSSFQECDFSKISQSRILILGCGGTGTHVAWNLAALGIRNFVLIDDDKVELSNLNRQLLYDLNDIGTYKVDALEKKLKDRFSGIEISTYKKRIYDGSDFEDLIDFENINVVVKGIDTPLDSMYKLGEYFYKKNIMYVSGGTVGTSIFLGPTFAPTLNNGFRQTKEYVSNSEMELTKRVSGKAVSIPLLFSYIGSELTKEIIFLLTNNESKVLYNDKIVIKDIFDNTTFKRNNLHNLVSIFSSIMVILSILNGDALMIVPAVLLLFIFQIYSSQSQKTIFITYLLISLILGVLGLFKQGYFLTNDLQTLVMIIFTLLSYVCYFSVILMLLKFAVTEVLKKINFWRDL